MDRTIYYRSLSRYKYILHATAICQTPLRPSSMLVELGDERPMIELSPSGMLTVFAGYAWDGPSGPTIDTKNFMRGSLFHDALYQLMRVGKLDIKHRDTVDRLLQAHCLEDGMTKLRAWWVYHGVRIGGHGSAKPQEERSHIVERAP